MSKIIGTYDPLKNSVIVDGTEIVGFDSSGVFALSYNSDLTTPTEGIKGDIVFTESASRLGTLTLTLLPNSPSINYLRGKARQDTEVSVMDGNDGTRAVATSKKCRIQKIPDKNGNSNSVSISIFMPDIQEF